MSWDREQAMVLPDGETEVEVHFTVESEGYPSNGWDDAGEGPELYITAVYPLNGTVPMEVTDAQREALEDQIRENPEWYERSPYPDE